MNQTDWKYILFAKRYSVMSLRLLWIVLPFLPLIPFLFPVFTFGLLWNGLIFLYFLPVWYVTTFVKYIFTMPDLFDPILTVEKYLFAVGYCCYIAYLLEYRFKSIMKKYSFYSVVSHYLFILIPLMLFLISSAGIPARKHMSVRVLKQQKHLWQQLKSCGNSYNTLSFQNFIRVKYKDGFMEYCQDHLPLKPFKVEDIPYVFWYRFIYWWHPKLTNDAEAYISDGFSFYGRGYESRDLVFIYDIPSEKVCYIWHKINF